MRFSPTSTSPRTCSSSWPPDRAAPEGIRRRFQNHSLMQVVMGIDPGAANLGFGIVRVEGSHMVALDGGVVETTPDLPLERRLARIHAALRELIAWHEPKAMAVGQASGVAMLAAAEHGVGCFSYTPQAIKMAVCGSGAAGKRQVQKMVGTLLGLPEPPSPDHAADALAVAICHRGGNRRRPPPPSAAPGGSTARGAGTGPRGAAGIAAAARERLSAVVPR